MRRLVTDLVAASAMCYSGRLALKHYLSVPRMETPSAGAGGYLEKARSVRVPDALRRVRAAPSHGSESYGGEDYGDEGYGSEGRGSGFSSISGARGDVAKCGHVTIVIPARNEERRIGPLLQSLQRLTYPDYDVLVVDDGSTDATVALAQRLGATVVDAGVLPRGWTGKCHACATGAKNARGDWILFTDADTLHSPDSLSVSLRAARTSGVSFLSLLCRQDCRTWWEDLLLPYAYFLYFVGYSSGDAVLNGQYILCRRDAYERIGGHSAVRDSIIEDVALARHAAQCGEAIVLARGERWVSVRMYESLGSLREGFAKNAARFVSLNPVSGLATALTGLLFLGAIPRAIRSRSRVAGVSLACLPAVTLTLWCRVAGFKPTVAWTYPVAAAVFQVIALESIGHVLVPGRARWRGRTY